MLRFVYGVKDNVNKKLINQQRENYLGVAVNVKLHKCPESALVGFMLALLSE